MGTFKKEQYKMFNIFFGFTFFLIMCFFLYNQIKLKQEFVQHESYCLQSLTHLSDNTTFLSKQIRDMGYRISRIEKNLKKTKVKNER